jgi:hypothetical protein
MKKLLLSSVAGGLITFVWLAISWMMIPWHQMDQFKNDAAVAEVLRQNAPEHGVYAVPNACVDKSQMEAQMAKASAGPFAFMIVRPGASEISMGRNMVLLFLQQAVGAFLIASLLMCARPLPYEARVFFVVQVALAGGILCHLPHAIWWEMPMTWILVELADLAIGWTLAGLVMAKIVKTGAPA